MIAKVKRYYAYTGLYDLHWKKRASRERIRLRNGDDPAPSKNLKAEVNGGGTAVASDASA